MDDKMKIYEAKKAANDALRALRQTEKHLKSARNWGIYDLVGGGFISSLVKHGKLNKAEKFMDDVKGHLVVLQEKLGHLEIRGGSLTKIGEFEKFMDIFFDNIISDWLVQSKIKNSRQEVKDLLGEIQRIVQVLDRLEREKG